MAHRGGFGVSDTGELCRYLSEKIGALGGVHTVERVLSLREIEQLTYEPTR